MNDKLSYRSNYFINVIFKLIIIIFILKVSYPAKICRAKENQVDRIVSRVQVWYDNLSDFQADFQQESYSQTLESTSKAKGKIYFKKPHLIKWDYQWPEKQLYLIDRENFWWYVPEDAQVVKKKAITVLQDTTPLSFLAGMGNLQKSFIISLADEGKGDKEEGVIFLGLTPRQKEPNIKEMLLKLETKNYQISGMIIVDPYGNTNDISFNDIKLNSALPIDLFQFYPPKGVDVVESDSEGGDIPGSH